MDELSYYLPQNSNGVIYSCDMIRLKFYLKEGIDDVININELEYFLHEMYDFNSQYWRSFSVSSYRNLYSFSKDDCVISLGLFHNSSVDGNGYHPCFIEFNPNKAFMPAVSYIFDFLEANSNYYMDIRRTTIFELVRWDLAVDIPIQRGNVKLLKKGKRKYTRIEEGAALTEYLGKRNTNGFVKIYDKTAESGLYYDLTRVEITNDSLNIVLPDVYIMQYQTSLDFDFELNATDKVLVELIKRQEESEIDYWLRQLGRNKREKLKPYVFEPKQYFEFDKKAIYCVIQVVEDICNMILEGGQYDEAYIKNTKQRVKTRKQRDKSAPADNTDWHEVNEEEFKKRELDYFNNYNRGTDKQPDNNV